MGYWVGRTGLFKFETSQFVPRPLPEVFDFFSDPKNLEKITPPFLNFRIVAMSTPEIQQGSIIDYQLKIHGVPAKWKTLIEKWEPNSEFVDTQLKGPYKLWHHTHRFEAVAGGTMIFDRVNFRLPFGFIGALIAGAFVQNDVKEIFAYRRKVIAETFRL